MAKLATTQIYGDLYISDYIKLGNPGKIKGSATLYYDPSTQRVTYYDNVPGLDTLPNFSITNASINDILIYNGNNVWQNSNELRWDSSVVTTSTSVGGVTAGTNLYGLTLKQILNKILYQYAAPNATLTLTPSAGSLEKGLNTTKLSSVALNYSCNNANYPLSKLVSISFNKSTVGSLSSQSFATALDSSSGIYTDSSGILDWVGTTYTFSVNNDYATSQPAKSVTASYSFYYRQYWGMLAKTKTLATLTETDIKGLLYSGVRSKSQLVQTFDNAAQNDIKYIFAYPDTASAPDNYGTLSSIIDQNNFNITSGFETGYINLTLDSGIVRYRVYIATTSVTNSSFKITFNF